MVNEIYELDEVKNEFIRNVSMEYAKVFNRQQMDLAIYLLNDFCNNLAANGLVLLRYVPQPQPQPQPIRPMPSPSMRFGNPFEEEPPVAEYVDPRLRQARTDELDVRRNIAEMNAQIQAPPQRMVRQPQPVLDYEQLPPMPQPPRPMPRQVVQDVDLVGDKPKTFVDKIKEMRVGKKAEKINPEE